MVFSVLTYEAANENGPLEQFDVDPATATVMDIMHKVRESTKLHNPHVRVGIRLCAFVDHVPGDLVNDTEKDPLALTATIDELQRSGLVQFEEDRRGLHLKVLVDGCRTAEVAAEFTLRQAWRTEYVVATLTRDLDVLKKERDNAVHLASTAIRVAEVETDTNDNEGVLSFTTNEGDTQTEVEHIHDDNEVVSAESGDHSSTPHSSFGQLMTNLAIQAANEGVVPALPDLDGQLPRQSTPSRSGEEHIHDNSIAMDTETNTRVIYEDEHSPLASRNGHIDLVLALANELGTDVGEKDNNGHSILHWASWSGRIDVVQALVEEFGADVNDKDAKNNTLLHLASGNGHIDIVKALVKDFEIDVEEINNDGDTPLHLASRNGHTDVVRVLVKDLGADANKKGAKDNTPLHLASKYGHAEVVRALVKELGADVNEKDDDGNLPLHLASKYGHAEVVRALVKELGADVNEKDDDGNSILHWASSNGHINVVKALVEEFVLDVNEKNYRGDAPLHLACRNGHIDIVKALVKFGAEVNDRSNDGNFPLHWASKYGHVDIVQMLVEDFGAEVNERNNKGNAPLSLMPLYCKEIRRFLEELGALN